MFHCILKNCDSCCVRHHQSHPNPIERLLIATHANRAQWNASHSEITRTITILPAQFRMHATLLGNNLSHQRQILFALGCRLCNSAVITLSDRLHKRTHILGAGAVSDQYYGVGVCVPETWAAVGWSSVDARVFRHPPTHSAPSVCTAVCVLAGRKRGLRLLILQIGTYKSCTLTAGCSACA